MTLEVICGLLAAMNVFQLVYWSHQSHKLLNKLMSRDFREYVHVEKSAKDKPKGVQSQKIDFADIDDMQVLSNFGQ